MAEDEVAAVRAEVEASKPDAVGAERPSSGKLESTLIWTSGFVERLLEVLGLAPSLGCSWVAENLPVVCQSQACTTSWLRCKLQQKRNNTSMLSADNN